MKFVWLCVVLAVSIDAIPTNYVPIKPFKHYGPPRISSVKEFFSTTEKHDDTTTIKPIITKIPDVVTSHVFVSKVVTEIPEVFESHSDVVHKYPGSTKPLVVFPNKQITKKPEVPAKEDGTPINNEDVPIFTSPLVPEIPVHHVDIKTPEIPQKVYGVPDKFEEVVQIIKKPEIPAKEYDTPIKHNEFEPIFTNPLVPRIPAHHVDIKTPEIPQKVYGVPDKPEDVIPVAPVKHYDTSIDTKPKVPAEIYGVPVEIKKPESNKKTFSPPKGFYRTPAHTNAPAVKLSEIQETGIISGGEFPEKASISEATIYNKPNVQIVHIHNATSSSGYHDFQNPDHFVFNPFLQTYFSQFKPSTSIDKYSQITYDKSVPSSDHFASNPFLQSHFNQITPLTSSFSSAVKPAEVNYEKSHSYYPYLKPYSHQNQPIVFKPVQVIQKPTETDYQQIIVTPVKIPFYQSVHPVVHIVRQPVQQSVEIVKPNDKFLPIFKPIEQPYAETVAPYPEAVPIIPIAKPVHDEHHTSNVIQLYPAGTKPLFSETHKSVQHINIDTKPIKTYHNEAPYPAEIPVVSTMKPVEHHPEIIPVKPEHTLKPVEYHEVKPVGPYPAAITVKPKEDFKPIEVKPVEQHKEIITVAGYPANVKPLIQNHVSKLTEIHKEVKPVGPYPAAVIVKPKEDFKPVEVKPVEHHEEIITVARYPANVKPLIQNHVSKPTEIHDEVKPVGPYPAHQETKPIEAIIVKQEDKIKPIDLVGPYPSAVPVTFSSAPPFDSSVFETTPKSHAPAVLTFVPSPSKLIIAPPPAPPKPGKIEVYSNPFIPVKPEQKPYVITLHKHPEESHEVKKQTYPASSFSHSRPEEFHIDNEAPYPPPGVPQTLAPYPASGEPQL